MKFQWKVSCLLCFAIVLFSLGLHFQRTEFAGELKQTINRASDLQHPHAPFASLIASLAIPLPKSSSRLLFTLAINGAHLRLLFNWIEGFNR
jgi:hypothetical protein